MKKIIITMIFSVLFLLACAGNKSQQKMQETVNEYIPKAVLEMDEEGKYLKGDVEYGDILHYFDNWYSQDSSIIMNPEFIEAFQKISTPVDVVCYLGTWCGDSRRGVPPFMKAVLGANNENIRVRLIAVNRDKNLPMSAVENDIERVPTFILSENGQEFARMIEFPMSNSFVEDFINIVGE